MGQHSHKPFLAGKRRWTAIAAGAAVIATASTTAYAAIANDDSPKRTATGAKPAEAALPAAKPLNEAARQPNPAKTPTPAPAAPKPPAAAAPSPSHPNPSAAAKPVDESDTPASPATKTAQPVAAKTAKASKAVTKKPKERVLSSGSCGASFYDEPQMTASGERFNPSAMTAAHKTLPLGSRVRVINPNNGKSVTVRINDRGPYVGGRCLDLSAAAFSAIGSTNAGVMNVRYQVLSR
ncbi:septal ring lytic transglycosylase RlpA family protein [Actinomadura luzonensis]|nr:septal ring lytic transglycosylase RlpA family protein [Actinomadura luzonensis]